MVIVVVALLVLLAVLPFSLYLPWVQNVAKDYACSYASKKTGLDISIDRVLLKFPLDLSVDGVKVLDEKRDTMAIVGNFVAGVEFMPLLKLNMKIGDAQLNRGYYRFVSKDSSMVMRAHIEHCRLAGTNLDFKKHQLNLIAADLDGGKIQYLAYPYRKQLDNAPDTAQSTPWQVNVENVNLRNIDYSMTMLPTIEHLQAHVGQAHLQGTAINTGDCVVDVKQFMADSVQCNLAMMNAHDAAIYNRLHPVPVDTSQSSPWRVDLGAVQVKHIAYGMTMLPAIDKLNLAVGSLDMGKCIVNMGTRQVVLASMKLDSTQCHYYTLGAKAAARFEQTHPTPPDTAHEEPSLPWMIDADTLMLTHGNILYATTGYKPTSRAFDPNYVEVSNFNLAVNHFHNQGASLRVPITRTTAVERCGLQVKNLTGVLEMNESKLDLNHFRLTTLLSDIKLDAHAPLSLMQPRPRGRFHATTHAQVALQELSMLSPTLKHTLKMVPQYKPIAIKGSLDGSPGQLNITSFSADIPKYAHAKVRGVINQPLNFKKLSGDLAFDANFSNINFVKPTLLDKAQRKQINLPPMLLNGRARFSGDTYAGNVNMKLRGGSMVGKGSFSGNSQHYYVDAGFNHFPIKSILPLSPADNLTGHVTASGHGFDVLKSTTAVNARVDIASVVYNKKPYQSIQARVTMDGGKVQGFVDSKNPNCNLFLNADGHISGNHYVFNLGGTINDLDAQALGFTTMACKGSGKVNILFDYNSRTQDCNLSANINQLNWNFDGNQLVGDATDVKFTSNDSTVRAYLDNEDSHVDFLAHCNMKQFMKSLEGCTKVAQEQLKAKNLDINVLQSSLPHFSLDLKLGPNGLLPRYLQKYNLDFRDIDLKMRNDSSIYLDGYVHQLSVGDRAIDTLTIHANEFENKYLAFEVHMGNRRGTWDEFAQVDLKGGVQGASVDMMVMQHNIKGELGYRLGVNATLADKVIKTQFFTTNPIIAYRQWEINKNNYIDFNYTTKMLDANLMLTSDASSLKLKTTPADDPTQEHILLNIDNLKLEEWLGATPYFPAMGGVVNANMDMLYDGHNFDGDAQLAIKDFSYNNHDEGDIAMTTNLQFDPSTMSTKLNASVDLDGSRVALALGTLTDSTSTHALDMKVKLDRFPLAKVTPFIPGDMIDLRGYLNGELAVGGNTAQPDMNGYVKGDSATIDLPRYGSSLALSDDFIPIDNGVVLFKGYRILGLNNRALTVDGKVNMNTMDMGLRMRGKKVQFIGSKQEQWSEVFGKAFADVDASIKGASNFMDVSARLSLLSGSNLTYVMQDEVSTLTSSSATDNMVTFINPNDSSAIGDTLLTTSGASAMNTVVDLDIQQGAKLNAYLSPDGKDRVTIDGSGRLHYSIDFAGKDNMVGTYTIENGNVRYSPPIISQKIFDITAGSKVTWTGDVLNPQLGVTGTERLKASVSGDDGKSRLVEFLVSAKLRNSLSKIDLAFDLEAENDMTVQNELQSMTEVQRSNTAIKLLLYNSYSGGNSTNVNLSTSGALFSFLQSQLNSWAASTLKGVDLTFGINQYGSRIGGQSSTETSYSYRLAKTLFNDRFKIVVGGEYSTEASSEQNFSSNLIHDISFEYNMNPNGSRYFRLFRHTGWESVLEGEVTKMGVGYVLKRKVPSLRDLFRFMSKQRSVPDSVSPTAHATDTLHAMPTKMRTINDEK